MKTILRTLLIIVSLTVIFKGNAQQKDINILNNIPKNDFWYKWIEMTATKIGLPRLANIKDNFHCRFWYIGNTILYVIDVSRNSDSSCNASVSLYTEEYVDQTKEKPTNRTYRQIINIDHTIALEIYKQIQSDSINQIPSDDEIKGWQQGDDGDEYIIESIYHDQYFCKSYWTPSIQENLKEAKIIEGFFGKITALVDLKTLMAKFQRLIPFEQYNAGGMFMAVRAKTKQQRSAYKKERDKYRKLMHIE
jgi:hypothetical protein